MAQTIALVDDDRNILTGISMALEREGFKVQTYIDGESALIGLTRNPPNLAILDIKMPRMDGEELLKKLKKKMSIPVIFLTSKDDEVDELLVRGDEERPAVARRSSCATPRHGRIAHAPSWRCSALHGRHSALLVLMQCTANGGRRGCTTTRRARLRVICCVDVSVRCARFVTTTTSVQWHNSNR